MPRPRPVTAAAFDTFAARLPLWPLTAALLLAACGSPPLQRDGPEARPPAGLERTPDAVPRVEPLRVGGPNKPYAVLGRSYTPMTGDQPLREQGLASWYGRKFHGRPTSNGEIYDMYAMTAAHKTMPLPSYARVRNPANGREIIVRVNDRGPFVAGRVIDLSYTAALRLGVLGGVAPVVVERLTHAQIRSGAWRSAGGSAALPPDDPAPGETPSAGPGFWLQLGAFRGRDGASNLQQQLQRDAPWLASWLAVFDEPPLYRLQAGPWARLEDAQGTAQRLLQQHGLQTVLVDRR